MKYFRNRIGDHPRLLIFGIVLLITSVTSIRAQYIADVSKVGTVAATFLEIGVGARATAMGEAFTAVSDDISAIYWNPAGLAMMNRGEAGFVHSQWLAGINFDHVSAVYPVAPGIMLGGFVSSVSMDEMKVRTIEYPEGTGELFETSDMALGLTFAARLTDKLAMGANGKYIRQNIWHMSASSLAADLGLLFHTPFKGLRLGMSVSNFGSDMQMEGRDTEFLHDIDPNNPGNNEEIPATLKTEEWSLPLTFRVGLAMEIPNSSRHGFTVAVDAVHPNDNHEYVNLGLEYDWNKWVFLRTGWKTLFLADTEQGFTSGGGLKYNLNGNVAFVADVAYADFGRLENVIKYSLGMQF